MKNNCKMYPVQQLLSDEQVVSGEEFDLMLNYEKHSQTEETLMRIEKLLEKILQAISNKECRL